MSIYEWKNERFSSKIQDIKTTTRYRCNTFTIHNITYIAFGVWQSTDAVKVLKWSGKKFEPFQNLRSSYVRGRPHIHANGSVYLAIANNKISGIISKVDSFIFRWNGIKFIHHQSIPTHGAKGWDSFSTAAGEVFLVVANSHVLRYSSEYKVKSAVYKMANNKFNLYQQLPSKGTEYVHAFTHHDKQYLAVVNKHDGKDYILDSPVYIWN